MLPCSALRISSVPSHTLVLWLLSLGQKRLIWEGGAPTYRNMHDTLLRTDTGPLTIPDTFFSL